MLHVNVISATLDRLAQYVENHGPQPAEYADCQALFSVLRPYRDDYVAHVREFHRTHAHVFLNPATMQGHVVLKPHGYAGDFEIIDRIYAVHTAADPANTRWDEFFHWGAAARAVRGRRKFAVELFTSRAKAENPPARILDIASGPCTDVRDALDCVGPGRIEFTCLDSDPNAIAHASRKFCAADGVRFVHGNALKLSAASQHDLVWSAGLFDYFDDRLFVMLLKRLARAVAPGGSLVIGNFGPANTQRTHMEFGFWDLVHRDEDQLRDLAASAGFAGDRVGIRSDETKVNLFMTIEF